MNTQNNTTKTMDILQLRILVRGAYQVQKLRIQTGNRIVGNFKVKLGQDPGTSEEDMEKLAKQILKDLRRDYKTLTEGVAHFPSSKKFKATGVISEYSELCMLEQYFGLEKNEESHFKRIGEMLTHYPIWNHYLKNVTGIGPALGGILISEIDIHKATYPSSLWKLAGLDVAWDNRGRSKRKEHLIEVDYVDANGANKKKKSITYKPALKTKLMGVAAASFLRVGREKSPYAAAYYDYKNRLENSFDHRDRFAALDVEACKQAFGKIPKKIYRKSHVTTTFERCIEHVRAIHTPDDGVLDDAFVNNTAKTMCRDYLGHYEIVEVLEEKGLLIGPFDSEDELSAAVKKAKGTLRRVTEKVEFIEADDQQLGGIEVTEEFDDTPDAKGRTLYKLVNIGKTKAHRHTMAQRYAIKRFLVDLYKAWRTLEGLPVMPEYSESVLNMPHKQAVEGKGQKAA